MSALAPTLEAFFTDRLARQRQASPETVAAYRDALRLLVCFASAQAHKPPSQLGITDLDATLIARFLDHLEYERHNSARTRKRPSGRRPFPLPLCCLPPSRTRRTHPTRARHSPEAI